MQFLQLSDIHFIEDTDGSHDLDREIRWELLEALRAIVDQTPIHAVLVSGDVAFSGQLAEYTRAATFLREVTSLLGIGQDMVYVIPGNHDIDWKITNSPAQRALRSGLRVIGNVNARDSALRDAAKDMAESALLTAPLAQYDAFAAQYDCLTTPVEPRWDRYLALTDEIELGLHGLNSVLASHEHDDADIEPVVVGTGQAILTPGDGRVHLAMCHHPKEWILDGDQITIRLNKKALLQITGHTHKYEVKPTTGGLWLRAGALQPSRKEKPWEPHFAIVELNPLADKLEVRVVPWAWNPDEVAFEQGPGQCETRALPTGQMSAERRSEIKRGNDVRRLTVRLAMLSASEVLDAAVMAKLPPLSGTLDDPPAILAGETTLSAISEGRLEQLWSALDALRGTSTDNPFA